MNPYKRAENPECTKAYKQVVAGHRDKAIKTLTAAGYADAVHQVEMIEGFIQFQEAWKAKERKLRRRPGPIFI